MSNTFTAPFAQTPNTASAKVTTAVALTPNGVDSTITVTNSVLLCTAGVNGAIMTELSALPMATVTASQLVVWSSPDAGTTKNMVMSSLMAAYTLAATTQNVPTSFKHSDNATVISEASPYRLKAGESLYVGTLVTGNIMFNARYSDF
jgi:hypothetical protein